MASICGPCGSLRNISDEATIRMMSAPMHWALGIRAFISRQAFSLRPASRPSGWPQASTRSRPLLVEHGLDLGQVARLQALEEARLQRDAVDAQLGGAVDEIVEGPAHAGVRLVRIDLAEVAVVAVAVDADFHGQISVRPSRPNTLAQQSGCRPAWWPIEQEVVVRGERAASACGRRGPGSRRR